LGWAEGEQARRAAALYRESVTQQTMQALLAAMRNADVTEALAQVRSPTLVFHRRQASFPKVDVARRLASRIQGARLALLEGASGAPYLGDMESVASAIDEFLGEGEETPAAAPSGLVTILFTDIESSSALRQRLGDTKAQELVHVHNTIVRDALKGHGGGEIKHTGDGIMASFPTASGGLECAVAIQRGVAAHVEEHPDAALGVYIGLNAGEPIAEEKDLFGTSVDLARRICDQADPGQILASDVVRQLAMGKGFLFSDRGDVVLRGFEDPVRLYEVRWREG
jgi:class 3 adenylate cyclase